FLGYAGAGLLAAALPGCGDAVSATPYGNTIAAARQSIQAVLNGNPQKLASISVALFKGNDIVWSDAFGSASMQTGTAATTTTRYNIASVSKVLAALAAVILQDRKQLDLDAPIVNYLPDFSMLSPEYAQITPRHLLSHASGFPGCNYFSIDTFSPIDGYARATMAILKNQHLKHLPGEMAVYCNDGFTIFELVVAAVTNTSYASFVQQNILAPLKMTNSGFLTTPVTATRTSGEFAYPYLAGKTFELEYMNAYASGGLNTTPSDMMNLAQMFIDQGVFQGTRIVSAQGIADMAVDQTSNLAINPQPGWPWGLGWDSVAQATLDSVGIAAWNKNGGNTFFHSDFFVLPHARMAILVTGSAGNDPRRIAETILLNALVEDGTLGALPPLVSTAVPPAATPPNVASIVGNYGNHLYPLRVRANGDGTLALEKWSGSEWDPLQDGATSYRYCNDGWWWSAGNTAHSYRFETVAAVDPDGNPYTYLMDRTTRFGAGHVSTAIPFAQKLPDRSALDDAWSARLQTPVWKMNNTDLIRVQLVADPGAALLSLAQIPDLRGYILLDNQPLVPLADDRGGMVLKIPMNMGRDLHEIVFTTVDGVATLTDGGAVLTPA
ncbi:serine hydrolase domain-containing protein, partial [Burkholderia sp. MR1-5-21]